nr:tetraketide alpha-pyrone reductase 2 [Ipomoea batatas]
MAEQEAWKWADEQNGGIELVVVNLSFVVGPLLTPQPTSTLQLILAIVKGLIGEYPNKRVGFVHIEDAVRAHILAMEAQNASGRLICSTTVAHFSQIIHMLRAIYPSYPYLTKCSNEEGDESEHSLDCSKIMELGLPPFATLSQMFDDCIHSFQQKGFL